MKNVKFIVFAHPTTPCGNQDDNFIKQDLKLDYRNEGSECAIGLQLNEATKILNYDDSIDIFLFNDTNKRPLASSIFFKTFCSAFFNLKDKCEFKIVLHKSSDWDFNSFETGEGKFYASYADEISWLSSLKENDNVIYQSHTPDEVYGKELKEIAKAIDSKNKEKYNVAIQHLDECFTDKEFEKRLNPFKTANPLNTDKSLQASKKDLQDYVNKLIVNS